MADVVFDGDILIERILEKLGIVDQRVDAVNAKASRIGSDARRARGGVSSEQVEQARRVRDAKRAADEEARAFANAIKARERQQREAARIAGQLRKDEERDIKRLAKEQERAFVQAIKAKERQQKEASRIAAQLRRDEERALKAFGDRQRRQTRQLIQEQERARREQAGQKSQFDNMFSAVFRANVAVQALTKAFYLLQAAIRAAFDAFQAFIGRGIEFNSKLETGQRSIAALIATYYDFRDAQGNLLSGGDALNAAFGQSSKIIEELRVAAAKTPLTFDELLGALQQVTANAGGAGVKIQELVPLTTELAQAVKVLGLDSRQVQQEIRALLTGDVGPDASLARALGLNKKMIDGWRAQGTLVAELNKRLEYFNLTAARSAENFDVLVSNIGDTYDLLAQQATEKTFGRVKEMVARLAEGLLDPVNARLRPEIQAIVDFIDDTLVRIADLILQIEAGAIRGLQQVGGYVGDNKKELLEIVDLSLELLKQIASLANALNLASASAAGVNSETAQNASLLQTIIGLLRTITAGIAAIRDLINNVRRIMEILRGVVTLALVLPVRESIAAFDRLIGRVSFLIPLMNRLTSIAGRAQNAVDENLAGLGFPGAQAGSVFGGARGGFSAPGATGTPRAPGGAAGKGDGGKKAAKLEAEGLKFLAELTEDLAKTTREKLLGTTKELANVDADRVKVLNEADELLKKGALSAGQHLQASELIRANYDAIADRVREAADRFLAGEERKLVTERIRLEGDALKIREREKFVAEEDYRERLRSELGIYDIEEQRRLINERAQNERLRAMKAEEAAVLEIGDLVRRVNETNEERRQREINESAAKFSQKLIDEGVEARRVIELTFQYMEARGLEAINELADQFGKAFLSRIQEQLKGADKIGAGIGDLFKDLSGRFGEGDLDQTILLQDLTLRLQELGISAEQIDQIFGDAAYSIDLLRLALERLEKGKAIGGLLKFFGRMQREADATKQALIEALQNAIPNVFFAFGDALGQAAAGVESFGSAIKKAFASLIGELASMAGRWLILWGIGHILFDPVRGAAAIAAGTALIAFSSYLSAKAQGSHDAAGAAGAATPGGANVVDINQARERRVQRSAFNTSGEGVGPRPSSFIPGISSGNADLIIEGEIVVSTDKDSAVEHLIMRTNRGTVRTKLKKRIA